MPRQGVLRLRLPVHPPPAADDALDVAGGAGAPDRQEPRLGLRRRHAGERPDLRVGELPPRQGLGQSGELPERPGHADLLARGPEVEPDPPGASGRRSGSRCSTRPGRRTRGSGRAAGRWWPRGGRTAHAISSLRRSRSRVADGASGRIVSMVAPPRGRTLARGFRVSGQAPGSAARGSVTPSRSGGRDRGSGGDAAPLATHPSAMGDERSPASGIVSSEKLARGIRARLRSLAAALTAIEIPGTQEPYQAAAGLEPATVPAAGWGGPDLP
jgi:hypothetical protein